MEDLSTINYLVSEIIALKSTIEQLEKEKTNSDKQNETIITLSKTNADLLSHIDVLTAKNTALDNNNTQLIADIKEIRRKKYKQRIDYEYLKLDNDHLVKTNKELYHTIQKLEYHNNMRN